MRRLLVGLIAVLALIEEPRSQGFQSPSNHKSEYDIRQERLIGRNLSVMFGRQSCASTNYGGFQIFPLPTSYSQERYTSPTPVVFRIESIVKGEGISRHYKLKALDGVIGYLSTNLTMFIESTPVESNLREGCTILDLSPEEISARIVALDERDRNAREAETREREEFARRPSARIGMSAREVIEKTNWGEPHSVNQTISSGSKSEQWVYGNGNYLYFKNGRLTTIQTGR